MKSFAGFATCILALTISIAQAQPPQKSKPRRLVVSGGVLQGKAIKKVSPPYPPLARAARAAGKVEVQVTISEQGEVIEALVVSGHPLLRDAAVNAAKQWVFMPTELNDTPVKVQGILTFNFTLLEDDSKEPDVVPRDAEGYLARGKARLVKDDAQGAIADFTKAIELDQQSFDAYFHRVIARFKTNDLDGSLADADKLIEINPRSSEAYFAAAPFA
jgi:TonB family protein